jgi:TPP-dependent pyruvate/acetoin dehydrogenase alpha subunit
MAKESIETISTALKMYVTMLKIRKFEERVSDLLLEEEIKCPTHLYIGQEAVAVGVCANLQRDDYVFSTHRSHGHYIAKGGDMKSLMAELYCRKTGCSKGKGGSMHIVAPEVGFMGSSSIVGGSLSLAVGTALASNIREDGRVSVTFFGDGATDEGVFHECLNFASLKKLPVIFVCENNLYSTHLRMCYRQPADNIYRKAELYMMPGVQVDGNNVMEVFQASKGAIESARNGEGPTLLEFMTYRWRAHVGPWHDLDFQFRTKEEVEYWIERCPIKRHKEFLLSQGALSESEEAQISSQIDQEIEESLTFAEESPFPDECELMEDVFRSQDNRL